MSNPQCCVLLPAAGIGSRMRSKIPKQFCEVLDRPIVSYTIQCFERIPIVSNIIVSVSADCVEYMDAIVNRFRHNKVSLVEGAETRHRSIYNAVKAIPNDIDIVIIHDAVRPLVDEQSVMAVANAAFKHGAAGVVRPLVSTVVSIDMNGFLDESLDRSKYQASEMPQAFKYDVIKSAYTKSSDYDLDHGTECLHLAQQYGGAKVQLIQGPDNLWKITHRKDVVAFEGLLKASISQVDVISHSCAEPQLLLGGICESLHTRVHQYVAVRSYTSDEYTAVHCQNCDSACCDNSAVMFLYDNIDHCNKHCETLYREMKHSYLVMIVAILVKSEPINVCDFMDAVMQLADNLPDEVIVNGIIVNSGGILISFIHNVGTKPSQPYSIIKLHRMQTIVTDDRSVCQSVCHATQLSFTVQRWKQMEC